MGDGTIRLPVLFCLLVDFPENRIDCSTSLLANSSSNRICFKCARLGRFLSGDYLEDHGSVGHAICTVLWVFILLIGIFGVCGNFLIIIVTRRQQAPRSFDFMLTALATFDLICCTMAVISASAMVIYYEGFSKGPITLVLYYIPYLVCLIGRSGSVYMTVLITLERYLVIAYPMKSSTWFTSTKTKCMVLFVLILAITINIPRYTSVMIDYNRDGQQVPSLRNLTYILRATTIERFWYVTLGSAHYIIDIFLPFPILIIFNVLLFIKIKRFASQRLELNRKLKRDIRAARMFVPVVVVLFICNLEPVTHYAFLHYRKVYYRELVLGFALSVVLNAAANLPIYYARGPSFREDIRTEILRFFSKHKIVEPTVTSLNIGINNKEISSAGRPSE